MQRPTTRAGGCFLTLFLLLGFLYLIPTIVAYQRDREVAAVAVINIALGWTVIGWVGALALAVSGQPGTNRRMM